MALLVYMPTCPSRNTSILHNMPQAQQVLSLPDERFGPFHQTLKALRLAPYPTL